jgi:uncharacterized protein YlzI (FlbEa/FlbD family)
MTFAQPLSPYRVGVVAGQIESVIRFIDGDELEVRDTVDEIDRAIGDLRTGRVPLIRVHGPDGRERRINAAHIKTVRRYDTSA